MAPLALTLALLPMAVAAATNDVVPLDMAPDSIDDQYRDCGPAMTKELPALIRSEFQQNPLFARGWVKAAAAWQNQGAPVSPLSPAQAIAVIAFNTEGLYSIFNEKVRTAGRSRQEYRDKFHFKTLHFLLTQAVGTMRDAQNVQCHEVFLEVCGLRFEAQPGATVRFGRFMPMGMSQKTSECEGKETLFKVHTCHGAEFGRMSGNDRMVLIPPFETFKVTKFTQEGEKAHIQLESTGTHSKYNCEWLRDDTGGSEPRAMGEHIRVPLPPRGAPPGHHSPGSGHRDALSHQGH